DLLDTLSNMIYDGGTNLLNFLDEFNSKCQHYDYAILFSDGFDTLSDKRFQFYNIPIYCIVSGNDNNHLLEQIACSSGGMVIDLREDIDLRELAERIGVQQISLVS